MHRFQGKVVLGKCFFHGLISGHAVLLAVINRIVYAHLYPARFNDTCEAKH